MYEHAYIEYSDWTFVIFSIGHFLNMLKCLRITHMPDKNEKKIYILYFELLCFKTMADKKLSEDIVKLKKLE